VRAIEVSDDRKQISDELVIEGMPARGYEIIAEAIEPTLKQLLGEK
jgi:hypothetical protein